MTDHKITLPCTCKHGGHTYRHHNQYMARDLAQELVDACKARRAFRAERERQRRADDEITQTMEVRL